VVVTIRIMLPGPPRWSRTTYDPSPLDGSYNWATYKEGGLGYLGKRSGDLKLKSTSLFGRNIPPTRLAL
jgi:hypothetical protein